MRLDIKEFGNPNYKRYYIKSEHGDFWTGSGWSKERGDAMIYASYVDLRADYKAIEDGMMKNQPVRVFEATITVHVYGTAKYDPDALKDYLFNAGAFYINEEKHGPGPEGVAKTQVIIDWNTLKEIARKKAGGG